MPPRNYRSAPRRSRFSRLLIGGFGVLTLMTIGIVGTLWLAGVPLNPFARVAKEDPYMVRIPINAQPIPAYTRVDRSRMINPSTGGLMYQKVPPASAIGMSIVGVDQNGSHAEGRIENVKRVNDEVVFVLANNCEVRQSQAFELGGALLNINSIIGRVVKRDKRAGLGFQESTFLPQGTPEGIAGATPAGMRAITLDATKLTGVHALGAGDQIDLLASFPVDTKSGDSGSLLIPVQSNTSSKGESSEPYLLAQKAVVLKPVYVRNEASTSASLTQGTRIQNIPKYEVAIAVNPDDLVPLQRALNQSLSITCIAHSMKPTTDTQTIASVEDTDTIKVPVTVHPVLAYNVVTREAFVSAATRTLKVESMSRTQVAKMDIITSVDEALGAIAKHDIPAGRYLRRSDLLKGPPGRGEPSQKISPQQSPSGVVNPFHNGRQFVSMVQQPATEAAPSATAVGDRPAITRFVPPGRTAFAIPWNRVYGSEHLQIGDEIDLMASYSLESTDEKNETETRADGTVIVRKSDALSVRKTERTWENSFGFRAEPWFVATDAIVIAPVGFPPPASAMRALGDQLNKPSQSANSKTGFSGPPVIIAVDDRDVEAVTAALATRDALFSVGFHSNNAVAGSLTRGSKQIVVASEPLAPYQEFNESIWQGNRRRITSRIVSSEDARFDDALTVDDVRFYYGRVLGRAKSRGDSLTAADFLPPGTKPGLAAGVPAGYTFFPVADREIEGLDSFAAEDHVAILIRGVVKPIAGVEITGIDYSRPVSTVVVADARIVRATLAGQTVLSIANQDLASLQAAIARSQIDRKENERSHLIAVVRPRPDAAERKEIVAEDIPAFDPLSKIRYTETIIGGKRSVKAFAGGPSQ
ncbi:MAG: hypothetical protein FJ308_14985 [Planctomycetes bacterium]|nr:hypothetical protein [Planctomycetota bacterium]